MNRKREQADLLFKFGQLLGPVLNAARNQALYDNDEKTRILARYGAEYGMFASAVHNFCCGEPGHIYGVHQGEIDRFLNELNTFLGGEPLSPSIADRMIISRDKIMDAIVSVPIPIDSTIYEARTPFTTYSFVKDLCSTVSKQIIWLDRYFDQTIFHRFFVDTRSTAQVVLVTLPVAGLQGRDLQRAREFMDISRMFAQQRGPRGFRLIENGNFHDRWLRCDDRLFTLGGSIKDLTKPFTISKLDVTPENMKHFDDGVNNGTEIFGPCHTTHP